MKSIILTLAVSFFTTNALADIVFDMTCQNTETRTGSIALQLSLGGNPTGNNFLPVSDVTGMNANAHVGYSVWTQDNYQARLVGSRIEVFGKDVYDNRFAGIEFFNGFTKDTIESLWKEANNKAQTRTWKFNVLIEANDVPVGENNKMVKGTCLLTVEYLHAEEGF